MQITIKPKPHTPFLAFVHYDSSKRSNTKTTKCRHYRHEQPNHALPATKLFDHRKIKTCFTPLLRTSVRKMILMVDQPVNREYAHPPLFCNQSEDYCQKQTIPAKLSTISATINTTHLQFTSQGAPTYHFHLIVIVCMSAPPGPFWSCLHVFLIYKYCLILT